MDKACPPAPGHTSTTKRELSGAWDEEEEEEGGRRSRAGCAALRCAEILFCGRPQSHLSRGQKGKVWVPGPAVPWLPLLRSPER